MKRLAVIERTIPNSLNIRFESQRSSPDILLRQTHAIYRHGFDTGIRIIDGEGGTPYRPGALRMQNWGLFNDDYLWTTDDSLTRFRPIWQVAERILSTPERWVTERQFEDNVRRMKEKYARQ